MAESPGPFAGWAKRDWIAFWVCIGVGMSVTEGLPFPDSLCCAKGLKNGSFAL